MLAPSSIPATLRHTTDRAGVEPRMDTEQAVARPLALLDARRGALTAAVVEADTELAAVFVQRHILKSTFESLVKFTFESLGCGRAGAPSLQVEAQPAGTPQRPRPRCPRPVRLPLRTASRTAANRAARTIP